MINRSSPLGHRIIGSDYPIIFNGAIGSTDPVHWVIQCPWIWIATPMEKLSVTSSRHQVSNQAKPFKSKGIPLVFKGPTADHSNIYIYLLIQVAYGKVPLRAAWRGGCAKERFHFGEGSCRLFCRCFAESGAEEK